MFQRGTLLGLDLVSREEVYENVGCVFEEAFEEMDAGGPYIPLVDGYHAVSVIEGIIIL